MVNKPFVLKIFFRSLFASFTYFCMSGLRIFFHPLMFFLPPTFANPSPFVPVRYHEALVLHNELQGIHNSGLLWNSVPWKKQSDCEFRCFYWEGGLIEVKMCMRMYGEICGKLLLYSKLLLCRILRVAYSRWLLTYLGCEMLWVDFHETYVGTVQIIEIHFLQ